MSVVTTIVPLFLLIVLGFVSIRAGYIAAGHIRPVGDFVIKVALPALIFQAVTSLPLAEALDWRFIGAYGAGSMAAFAVGLVVARRAMGQGPAPAGIVALGMSGSNSGFMGYPIALSVVGAGAGPLLAQCMVVENVLIIPLALALAEGAGRGRGWRALVQALRGLVSNPIIMALIAALAVSATGLRLPAMLDEAIGMLARIAPPIALFVLGGTVAALPMAGVRAPAAAIVAGKLVLHPLAVLAALWAMPGIEPWVLVGGVIFAAAPMLSIYPLFGQRAGIEMLTATALLIAVLASFVTMTLWIAGMTALVGL